MRHYGGHAGAARHVDRVVGLRQSADLIELDQDRVGYAFVDAPPQPFGVGHEQVVAHQLQAVAQRFGEQPPPLPIVLRHAVFDRDDRIALGPVRPEPHHLFRCQGGAAGLAEGVAAGLRVIQLRGRRVQRDGDVVAGLQPDRLDTLHDQVERSLVGREIGGKAAFVTDRRRQPAVAEHPLERMEDLGAHAHRLAQAGRADRNDHELLELQAVVGVCAAVDDVGHRHRQQGRMEGAQIAIQRQIQIDRGGARHGQRDPQDRVGSQDPLVRRPVQFDHLAIDPDLVDRIVPDQVGSDAGVDVLDRLEDSLAAVPAPAVAQLDRFVRAGRCAGRHCGASARAAGQLYLDLYGGIPARIEDLTRRHRLYRCHCVPIVIYGAGSVKLESGRGALRRAAKRRRPPPAPTEARGCATAASRTSAAAALPARRRRSRLRRQGRSTPA